MLYKLKETLGGNPFETQRVTEGKEAGSPRASSFEKAGINRHRLPAGDKMRSQVHFSPQCGATLNILQGAVRFWTDSGNPPLAFLREINSLNRRKSIPFTLRVAIGADGNERFGRMIRRLLDDWTAISIYFVRG